MSEENTKSVEEKVVRGPRSKQKLKIMYLMEKSIM